MQAAVFHGPRDTRLTEMAVPTPQAGEVLVKVQCAGICGSDLNRFHYGSHPWPPGFIMGHEFCGEIAALGAGVDAPLPVKRSKKVQKRIRPRTDNREGNRVLILKHTSFFANQAVGLA